MEQIFKAWYVPNMHLIPLKPQLFQAILFCDHQSFFVGFFDDSDNRCLGASSVCIVISALLQITSQGIIFWGQVRLMLMKPSLVWVIERLYGFYTTSRSYQCVSIRTLHSNFYIISKGRWEFLFCLVWQTSPLLIYFKKKYSFYGSKGQNKYQNKVFSFLLK